MTSHPEALSHDLIDPAILYFGTPVCLVGTRNDDGSSNLAPMSSVFWLGKTALLGLGAMSQTCRNLLRERECVINLPSAGLVDAVDRLALTTGRGDVPPSKVGMGYRTERDKFAIAGLTDLAATLVDAPRVRECPVNLESQVVDARALGGLPLEEADVVVFEVDVVAVHVHPALRVAGHLDRIDPDLWRPLIMSFQQFYGLGSRLRPSTLATIEEDDYR